MATSESESVAENEVRLFLAGDVMTGRGIDQILGHPGSPELREAYVDDARTYVELAERAHGPVPRPVDGRYVWGQGLDVLTRWRPQASVVNLETCVTTEPSFWPHKAVHYRMNPRNVDCLTVANIDACSLANNHVLDFGREGLAETLATLRAAGIASAGAGSDIDLARQPVRIELDGDGAVLVFAVGHASSGIPADWAAGRSRSGVNLIPDVSLAVADEIIDRTRAYKQPGDLVVVSIHWGGNWGYSIDAVQVAFAHHLVNGGVDVIHGHSSHHVRAVEIFQGKLILYGCGDLITDYEGIGGHQHWRGDLGAMYFATIDRRDGRLTSLNLVPTTMRALSLSMASRHDRRWLLRRLNRISEPFSTWFDEGSDGTLVARANPVDRMTTPLYGLV